MLKKTLNALLFLALASLVAGAQTRPAKKPAAPAAKTPAPQTQPAADPHAGHGHQATAKPKPPAEPETAAGKWFTDVELVDQDGKNVRFYSDVLKGKTVVVNAFFTTCTSVCPPMNRNFEKIQEAFGERVGKDVFLVSISVDPVTDTPPRLKEYAKKFNARAGWTFLTGKKENVETALYKLGQYIENKDDHKTIIIIGNETTGLWKKAFGMARPEELIAAVKSVADDPSAK